MWWTKPLVHPYMRIVGRYDSFPHPNHLLVESESRRLSPIFPIFSYKSVSVLYRFLILQSLSLVWI